MLSELKRTSRGFRFYEFKDNNDYDCTLQKSSVATEPMIWLGLESASPKRLVRNEGWLDAGDSIPGDIEFNTRMHLTQSQAKILSKQLEYFADTGELPRFPYG